MSDSLRLITRRGFAASLAGVALGSRLTAADASMPWMGPAIVRKVFLAVPKPTWPRPDLDVAAERAELDALLVAAERRNAGAIRFTGGELVRTPADAEAFVKTLGGEDAVLVVDLTSGTSPLLRPMRDIDMPILLYARPYSGWSYVDVTSWAHSGRRADLISTSDPGELDLYIGLFRSMHHLRNSKVIVVSQASGSALAETFTKQFGTAFSFAGYDPLRAAYNAIEPRQVQRDTDEFVRGALRVVEPRPQEIADAVRFYQAVRALLNEQRANAITIDCLGGFNRGDLPAYPCVTWSKLNDAGLYGVCEADIAATMTQMLLTSISGKPAFVSDPVFDTGRNEIIHAHCVSATKLLGGNGPASPYVIRSHMEDNKGVSLQVLVPERGTVTAGKFLDAGRFAISTGEVAGNVDDARGCRTKFRTRVPDARKFLEGFTGGLHRVVVYGDYARPVERMGRLLGFSIVHEG